MRCTASELAMLDAGQDMNDHSTPCLALWAELRAPVSETA